MPSKVFRKPILCFENNQYVNVFFFRRKIYGEEKRVESSCARYMDDIKGELVAGFVGFVNNLNKREENRPGEPVDTQEHH